MSNKSKDAQVMIGPIQIKADIHFRIGEQTGSVAFGFPPGKPVTEQDILAAIGNSLVSVRKQFEDSSLLDAESFFNDVLVAEKTGRGGKFALPASLDYDAEKLEDDALNAAKDTQP